MELEKNHIIYERDKIEEGGNFFVCSKTIWTQSLNKTFFLCFLPPLLHIFICTFYIKTEQIYIYMNERREEREREKNTTIVNRIINYHAAA